jgi:predicted nucleotidyltransferase
VRYGLPDRVIESLVEVISRDARIEKTVLFGSRAKGTYTEGSDIDLCLLGSDIDLSALSVIEASIDELNFPWIVDLVPETLIDNTELLDHIRRVGATIYDRGLNQ